MRRTIDGRTVLSALVAGLVGAVTVEVYLFAAGLAAWPGTYQWIASALRGPDAFTRPADAWLGLGMHVAVSVGWAFGWALLARAWPRAAARPVPWGLGYGLVVFAAMQVLTAGAGIWVAPTPAALFHSVVDHALFYGAPVAATYGWARERRSFRRPAFGSAA